MGASKIIFYSTIGPDGDDRAWRVFRYAERSIGAGVETEIMLMGPATGLLRADSRQRLEGDTKDTFEAVLAEQIPIWVGTGCSEYRGVTDVELKEVGAQRREQAELFKDMAAGAQLFSCDGVV